MATLDLDVVDVFTDRPFAGNPLAVVHGGDGLGTGQMQALADDRHAHLRCRPAGSPSRRPAEPAGEVRPVPAGSSESPVTSGGTGPGAGESIGAQSVSARPASGPPSHEQPRQPRAWRPGSEQREP